MCGTQLTPGSALAREQRKVVTILFCDLVGSTALGESTDPEALRARMRRYFEDLRVILERHGGTVEKFVGDAVMAVFGIPVSHEDDALRAVRSAAEMQAAISEHGLEARIGVNTGEVVVGGQGETLVTGDAVNVAARLEQAAGAGVVFIGAETHSLVRDAVRVEAVRAARAQGEGAAGRGVLRPRRSSRVGRACTPPRGASRRTEARTQSSLAGLRGRSRRAVVPARHASRARGNREVAPRRGLPRADRRCGRRSARPVPLVRRGDHLLAARGDPDLDRRRARVHHRHISAETQLAFRRLLEARASDRPQVVVVDDLQWAEPVFIDLVEHVADLSRDAPIFLLCVARTELLDIRPEWGGGKLNATSILLEPLG